MHTTSLQPTRTQSRLDQLVERHGVDGLLHRLTEEEWRTALYDWEWNCREGQTLPPGDWRTWLIRAGRGWGKTRVGVEAIRYWAEEGEPYPMYIIGATGGDVRDVMVEGESGILAKSPPWFRPEYEPSKRRLTWPNGVVAFTRSADRPDRMRGPQGSKAWLDELAAWRYGEDAIAQVNMMIRLGDPRLVITTTPRPTPLIRELLSDPDTVVTRGSTRDNLRHLARKFITWVFNKYGGTRLGRQELEGEMLDDNPNALVKQVDINAGRWPRTAIVPQMVRMVVSIDPAVTSNPDSDETGIIVAGKAPCRCKGRTRMHGFVFEDCSDIMTAAAWAEAAIKAYGLHRADRVLAEVNNGGDLVERNLRAAEGGEQIPYGAVHASRGKEIRHEPIAALYEQHVIHHLGTFGKLEDQMVQWDPTVKKNGKKWSPDRFDALTIAMTALLLEPEPQVAEVGVTVISG